MTEPIKPLSWVNNETLEVARLKGLSDDARRLYFHSIGLGWFPKSETEDFMNWVEKTEKLDPAESYALWRSAAYKALFALEEWTTTGKKPHDLFEDTTQEDLFQDLRGGLYAAERLLGNR